MSNYKIRSLRWLAPVVIVGAVGLAACGDEDASESAETVDAAAADIGSDRHLDNQAAEIAERSERAATARLAGQAEAQRYVDLQQERAQAGSGNGAALSAEAERYVDLQQERAQAN